MVPRFRPQSLSFSPLRVPGFAACLCASALATSFSPDLRAAPAPAKTASSRSASPLAAELSARPDATAADTWLTHNIPVGTTLADHPNFFAAAHEVFFDAEENLLVFVYRSADRGNWIAWVSFDSERMSVVHTAASAL